MLFTLAVWYDSDSCFTMRKGQTELHTVLYVVVVVDLIFLLSTGQEGTYLAAFLSDYLRK